MIANWKSLVLINLDIKSIYEMNQKRTKDAAQVEICIVIQYCISQKITSILKTRKP